MQEDDRRFLLDVLRGPTTTQADATPTPVDAELAASAATALRAETKRLAAISEMSLKIMEERLKQVDPVEAAAKLGAEPVYP